MKRTLLTKTMLLLCALIAGSSSVWATDRTITVSYSGIGSDGITGTSWGTSYVAHRWTGESSDGTTVIYMGGTAAKQSNAFAIKNTASHILGNIDPGYDASTEYDIPTGVVGAIPGKIKKIEVSFISSTASGRGVYIHAGNSQIVTNDGAATGTGIVKSDKLSNDSGEDVSVEYDVTETAYTYFAITGANSSYTGISSYKITYAEDSSDPSSDASFTETEPEIYFPATTTYSQAATTAAEYIGTVTYEITANTAGATLEGTTLTVTQEGSVTVKATAPAITGWAQSEATYTLTVTDTRSASALAYGTATQDVVVGEVLSAPTLTNPNSLDVTYESDDTDIATVDASGNVTGVAKGSTTIRAIFAGNSTHKPGSASYTINVKKAAATDGVFDFTYEDEIDYGTGLVPSTTDIKEAKTFTAGNITLTPEPTATNKYWRWYTGGTLRLYTDTKMTIAAPDGYAITRIDFEGTQNLNAVTVSTGNYEAASGNKSATWTGCAQSIVFTRDSSNPFYTNITVTYGTSAPVTVTSAGWATFSAGVALDFEHADDGIEAYMITGVSGTTLTTSPVAGTIPANTGLLVKGAEGTYNVPVVASSETATTSNKLVACLKATTVKAGTDSNVNYVLVNNGGTAEFQWIDDKAATVGAGKAYLTLAGGPTPAAPALTIDIDGNSTAIDEVRGAKEEVRSDFFDLQGRKVANPTKGLYIVNGKKYVVK